MWSQNFNWIPSKICCFVLLANWEVFRFYVFDGTRWLWWVIFRPVGLQSGVSGISWIFFSYSSDHSSWQIPATVIGMCWIFLFGRSGVWMLQHVFSCGLFRIDGSLISVFVDLWHRPRSVFQAANVLWLLGPVTFASDGERSQQLSGLLVCITVEPVKHNCCSHQSFRRQHFAFSERKPV